MKLEQWAMLMFSGKADDGNGMPGRIATELEADVKASVPDDDAFERP